MSVQTLRDEMIEYIKSLDESTLQIVYNKWKDDQKIVGYRPGGKPISLADLKKSIEQSDRDLANGNYLSVAEARNASRNGRKNL